MGMVAAKTRKRANAYYGKWYKGGLKPMECRKEDGKEDMTFSGQSQSGTK